MQAESGAGKFARLLGEAFRQASQGGLHFHAGGANLEWESFRLEEEHDGGGGSRALDAFEHDPVVARYPGEPAQTSRFEYFLDGVQRTEEIGRVGTVPVVVTTVAAGIARREGRRLRSFPVEGVPRVLRAVILPVSGGDERIQVLGETLRESGLPLVDSDAGAISSGEEMLLVDSVLHGETDPADYPALKGRAYRRANALRGALEAELLRRWAEIETGDGWIAVDGQLPLPVANAAGLVKGARRLFFGGEEARMLLELEEGMRTTAFVPPWRKERVEAGREEEERASWYVRLHPAYASGEGADATAGLVRVETVVPSPSGEKSTAVFDEVSRWLLAERAPLAKPDPRWHSMIYPIAHVERLLKPLLEEGRRARYRLEREIAALEGGRG
ncbi:hypothetical protein [Rubrobacter calidifluminis]|uniref:hypothetical protein n=1 Tax=Rubrobacter calidifluminis TaxID=1392640 RepID=UPI00235FA399|nr:hypothetical protein [Rubrobacter calidifluminis]